MNDAEVLAKRAVAVNWCRQATDHAATCGSKPWRYLLIPHDIIAENMTLAGLAAIVPGMVEYSEAVIRVSARSGR